MTTIAWDGTTLAADKRGVKYGYPLTLTKIWRVRGALIGICGSAMEAKTLKRWFEDGAKPEDYPAFQTDKDRYSTLLVIEKLPINGIRILEYGSTPDPMEVEEFQHAIGSGRDFALAAMAMGKSARYAVELATRFDTDTGNGVDELRFDTD